MIEPTENSIQLAPIETPSVQPAPEIPLASTAQSSWLLDPQTIASRSFKAAYGLVGTPAERSREDLFTGIYGGQERNIRAQTADTLSAAQSRRRSELVSQAISQKQGPLSEEDLKWIDGTSAYNHLGPLNPDNVFETTYSENLMQELDRFAAKKSDTHFWNVAKDTMQDDVSVAKKYGSITTAWRESLLTLAQDMQSEIKNQTWPGYIADWAKINVVPGYYDLKLRASVPDVSFWDGFIGGNLEDTRNALLSMPFQQGFQKASEIANRLKQDNPQLAFAFVMSMLGQSTSERVLNNFNTMADLTLIPGTFKFGASVYRAASLMSQVRTAAKDVIRGTTSPEQTRANILAAVGDVEGSAMEKAAGQVTDILTNTSSTKDAYDSLTRFFKQMREDIQKDPAELSTTQRNSLLEQVNNMESRLMQVIVDTPRPLRVALANAPKEFIQNIKKEVSYRYPGMSNAILDISDPVLNPISNTYHMTMRVGKGMGDNFSSFGEALQYGRDHGFKITLSEEQLKDIKAEIDFVKDQIKTTPSLEEDVAGLNRYYTLEDRLKELNNVVKEGVSNSGHKVVQQGGGFQLELQGIPLNEKSSLIRDFIATPDRVNSVSPTKSWADWIPFSKYARTSEDTMSQEMNRNRKAAVFPLAKLFAVAQEEAKFLERVATGPIKIDPNTGLPLPLPFRIAANVTPSKTIGRVFNREIKKDFDKVLEYAQKAIDPDIKDGLNNRGYYFRTVEELQKFYVEKFHRMPTFVEVQAYQAQKNLTEMHRVLAEISLYRNMSEVGAESHVLNIIRKKGAPIQTKPFTAVTLKAMPGGRGTILVEGTNGTFKSMDLATMPRAIKAIYTKEIEQGRIRVLQFYNPEELPLNGVVKDGDKLNHFIMSKNIESSPLSWSQLPRRGGGHLVPDYDHYVKQAIIKNETIGSTVKNTYLGDQTLMPVANRVLGNDVAKKLNQVRILIKAGKEKEAEAFAVKYLPYEWNELRAKFNPRTDEFGRRFDPQFNMDEEFRVVPRNTAIIQLDNNLSSRYGDSWRDGTRENSLARNYQVEFTQQRDAQDLHTFKNTGTVNDPIYSIQPAKYVDPLKVSDTSLSRMIRSFFFDDYKTAAVEAWVREAKDFLDASENELASSPFFHFFNPAYLTGFKKEQNEVLNTLKANRFKIMQLVGTPGEVDNWLYSRSQLLSDYVYENLGPKTSEKLGKLVPQWLLPTIRDPSAFIRSVTFNAYLGVYAIPQLWVQMSTFVNIWAISPTHAPAGTAAMYAYQLTRINKSPAIVAAMDGILSKIRIKGLAAWNPGEFTEAMKFLDRSGFGTVAGEYGPLSTFNHARIMEQGGSQFLRWGQTPFREGERATRLGAYFTAFKEYRGKNPTGRISREDELNILNRADLLYGNMSSASNSTLHTGILSLPTQFYAYAIRQAEIFGGKRLGATATERAKIRARILAFNAAAFGIPMAAGVTGLPVGDYLRKAALDEGYVVGDNWINSLLMEGLPSSLLALATGRYYNVGARYGLQGFTQIREALSADGSVWKLFGGAPASFVMNTAENSKGFYNAMWYLMHGDTKTFPFTLNNLIDVGKDVKSVSSTRGLWVALNTGAWINKNSDIVQKDVTKADALWRYVTGLTDQRQTDVYNKRLIVEDRNKNIQEATKGISEALNRSILSRSMGDKEQSDAYMAQAAGYGASNNLTSEQWSRAIANAVKRSGGTTTIDKGDWDFYEGFTVPQDKQKLLHESYKAINKRK